MPLSCLMRAGVLRVWSADLLCLTSSAPRERSRSFRKNKTHLGFFWTCNAPDMAGLGARTGALLRSLQFKSNNSSGPGARHRTDNKAEALPQQTNGLARAGRAVAGISRGAAPCGFVSLGKADPVARFFFFFFCFSLKQPRSPQRLLQCGCRSGFTSWALQAGFVFN